MANRYDQKPSQRRSDLSPTRNHHSVSGTGTGTNTANNFRDRSNERYEPNNRKNPQKSNKNPSQRDMNDLTLEEEQTIEKEQNERGRKLTKSEPESNSNEIEIEDSNDDSEMMKLMGFGSFQTTKNQKVQGQVNGAVKKNKKTEFRQYMNREKGFNRALSPDRDGKQQHKKRR